MEAPGASSAPATRATPRPSPAPGSLGGALGSWIPTILALQTTASPGKGGLGLLAPRALRFQEKAGVSHAPYLPGAR